MKVSDSLLELERKKLEKKDKVKMEQCGIYVAVRLKNGIFIKDKNNSWGRLESGHVFDLPLGVNCLIVSDCDSSFQIEPLDHMSKIDLAITIDAAENVNNILLIDAVTDAIKRRREYKTSFIPPSKHQTTDEPLRTVQNLPIGLFINVQDSEWAYVPSNLEERCRLDRTFKAVFDRNLKYVSLRDIPMNVLERAFQQADNCSLHLSLLAELRRREDNAQAVQQPSKPVEPEKKTSAPVDFSGIQKYLNSLLHPLVKITLKDGTVIRGELKRVDYYYIEIYPYYEKLRSPSSIPLINIQEIERVSKAYRYIAK